MAVVLRMQGLNNEAGSEDIREFFHDLRIPQGAVHILGGDLEEAFILFTSERDGQLAMRRSRNLLKGSPVTLHISSIAELKQRLASSLKQDSTEDYVIPETQPANCPDLLPVEKSERVKPWISTQQITASLLLALKDMDSKKQPTHTQEDLNSSSSLINVQISEINHSPSAVSPSLPVTKNEKVAKEPLKSEALACNPGHLRLYGLPDTVTEADISRFLHGLHVREVHVNVRLGDRHGCLVKVASKEEEEMGLKLNMQSLGEFPVEIRRATVKQWAYIMKKLKQNKTVSFASPEMHLKRQGKCTSMRKRPHSRNQIANACKEEPEEYYIMVRNLQPNMNKTKIKTLLGCPHLQNKNILHLLDENRMRTSTAFVAFDRVEDYVSSMNLSGSRFGKLVLDVSSVTREKMMSQIGSYKAQGSSLASKPVYM